MKRLPVVNGETLEQRLMREVVKGDACWRWVGSTNSWGYGGFSHGGQMYLPHRAAYELFVGPIPEGLHIDHLCRNPACVNPDHLEAVTNRENALRGIGPTAVNARKTHCVHGHEFTPENTYWDRSRGSRHCRACAAAREVGRWQRRKAKAREGEFVTEEI